MKFVEMLKARWRAADTLLCVGLDPDPARFPEHLRRSDDSIFEFCKSIVDATADFACAFKPQIAYFASAGAEDALQRLITYIRASQPAVPVILDAKRGDMASTAQHYAREVFERYNAHAVTLSPYLGFDSIEPYLAYADRGCVSSVPYQQRRRRRPADADGGRRAVVRARGTTRQRLESQRPDRARRGRYLSSRTRARARARWRNAAAGAWHRCAGRRRGGKRQGGADSRRRRHRRQLFTRNHLRVGRR